MLFAILSTLALTPICFWQIKSWSFRLLSNSVAYWVLTLNYWVLSTKLSFPSIFTLGSKCSFSSKNKIFFSSPCVPEKKIWWKHYDKTYTGLGTINVLLKELHKIIRPIPVCTGKKAGFAWLRQHIISTNACETQFFMEHTGSPQENPVLIALSAEFAKFTSLIMSNHLWISILYKSCSIIRVYSHSLTSTMKIEQEKRTAWLFYLRKEMSLKFFWFSWRRFFF